MKVAVMAVLLLGLVSGDVAAQKKKEIKKNKIKSMTVYSKDLTGKEYRESYTRFDANGNVLEDGEYKSDGSVSRKELNKYDKNNEQVEHLVYAGPSLKKKVTSSYNALGDKVTEIDYDENGNVISKSVFSYDKKGMKVKKEVYDSKGKLIESKRFNYEY